ncbi:hypothetical protein M947_06110 [Sulfurimonas hongkongensis]|uniref:Porin domain-containing protein n=1 Tax=Sulfurimonas hongkongensis TaxID=1172190 RepID=T0L1B6_9BACT|nr:hypothetical protein [Sulfurimonas hongkongensis]EQB39563.1 hypothetical protein M947_06110 [Sulfurimonas hongkongensis]
MKKTMVSLAAASLIATTAMAADKGIDIVTTGQAVLYYETGTNNGDGTEDVFHKDNSQANVGLQLNLDADLKNNFTFGSQLSYLGTAGLEKNLVTAEKQPGINNTDTRNQVALTQIFVAKKIANTTVKIGRQELPKSLSPFAYSEGWSVFKNTFDAILAVNTDIPDTTLVGAYVSGGTGMDLSSTGDLTPVASYAGKAAVDGTAYMLTVQNKSIPMTTVTASYYGVSQIKDSAYTTNLEGADALWADVAIAGKDLPMGLKLGLQGGTIMTDSSLLEDTTAFGVKVGIAPVEALTLCAAFTTVDGDDSKPAVAIKNFGTGIKSPLYTQMTYNQDAISLDADTFLLKAAYNTGDYGTVIAQGTMTSAGKANLMGADNDYNEFDLIYKVKAAGVQYFAGYIYRDFDKKNAINMDTEHRVRLWGRYNF